MMNSIVSYMVIVMFITSSFSKLYLAETKSKDDGNGGSGGNDYDGNDGNEYDGNDGNDGNDYASRFDIGKKS